MPGKVKAALLGAIVGAVIVLIVELLAVVVNDEAFFGSERSWMLLAIGVVVFAWFQVRAYDQRRGMYANRDDPSQDVGTPPEH